MAIVATLDVVLRANTAKFSKAINQAKISLTGLGRVAAAAGAAVSAAGTAAFVKTISSAADFQRAMANSTAIMGELTDVMRQDMVRAAQLVARETKFSATEAAEAYFFLASAGLDAQKSIAALPLVSRFAQAGAFDLALATDLLTDAQSALGLASEDTAQNMENMKRVSDVLVRANVTANAKVQEFSESLTNKAGAALRNLNKDIEEGVAVLAVFANQGLKGSEAGTALSIVLRDLQSAAVNNNNIWRTLGISVFDSTGKIRNIADIIGDLERIFAPLTDEQKKLTAAQLGFQDKSFGFIQSLLGQSEELRKYEEKLRDAGDATDEVANNQITNFDKKINELKATFETFAIDIGTPILDAFGESSAGVNEFARALAFVADVVASIVVAIKAIPLIFAGGRLQVRLLADQLTDFLLGVLASFEEKLAAVSAFVQRLGGAFAGFEIKVDPTIRTFLESFKAQNEAAIPAQQAEIDKLAEEFGKFAAQEPPGERFLKTLADQEAARQAREAEKTLKEQMKQTRVLEAIRDNPPLLGIARF